MGVNDDDTILLFPGRLDRAIENTGGIFTLIAKRRKKVTCNIWIPTLFDDFHPRTKYA